MVQPRIVSIKNGKKWSKDKFGNWHFEGYASGRELNEWYKYNRLRYAGDQYGRIKKRKKMNKLKYWF